MLFWIQKTHTHTPHKQPTRMRHQPTVISTSSSWNDRFNLEQNIEVLETTSVSAKRSPPPPVLGAWGWGDWSPAAVIYNVRTIYLYLITICVLCDVWSGTKEVKRKIHASKSSSTQYLGDTTSPKGLAENQRQKMQRPLTFHGGKKIVLWKFSR